MYAIDLNTCSMLDVIERSAVCHPTLFAEALQGVANVHGDYAGRTYSAEARRIAEGMCKDAAAMSRALLAGGEVPGGLTTGQIVIAFNEACELQLIRRATRQEIADRG